MTQELLKSQQPPHLSTCRLLMNAASLPTAKRSSRNFAPELSCTAASKWGHTLFLNCSQGPLKSHNFQVFWQGGHTRAHERRVAWGKEGIVTGKLVTIHCSGHLSQKKQREQKNQQKGAGLMAMCGLQETEALCTDLWV